MPGVARFGPFEFNPSLGELRKHGLRVRVPHQSLQILAALVERPGEIVSRDRLRSILWPHGTVVGYEQSLNAAITRLRSALGDSADGPRYIERVPRQGYRFVVPVEFRPQAESAPAADSRAGTLLLHYRLIEKAGAGSMGEVWKAEDTKLARTVALKFLPRRLAADAAALEAFRQEALHAAALNHPNICTVHCLEECNGEQFLVMEYIEGRSLSHVLGVTPFSVDRVLDIGIQAATALAAAHAAGVIHRDVKPANLMLTADGRLKLTDFGVAIVARGNPAASAGGRPTPAGTLSYMSPEQAGGKPVDARSDIFSLGSVLYELATGRRPFERDSPQATLAAILRDEPPAPARLAPGVSPGLERGILRCLRKHPDARWQTMPDLRVALENERESLTGGRVRRRRWSWAVAGLLLAATAAGVIWTTTTRLPEGLEPDFPVTFDAGLTSEPSISPDGKLVAYASDRDGENCDIWLQRTGSTQPVRLTHEPGGARCPSFSPDGARVFFALRWKRGGICSIDTLGGDRRAIVDSGFNPSLSPDGSRIAYAERRPPWHAGKMFIVPAAGGVPTPFQPAFSLYQSDKGARAIWSPDGTRILFPGIHDATRALDWYVADVTSPGRPAVPTGFAKAMGIRHAQHPVAAR